MKCLIISLLIASSIFAACNKEEGDKKQLPIASERKEIVLTKAEREYLKKGNHISLKLLNDLIQDNNNSSFVISPLSVEYVLALLANGSAGDTFGELLEYLEFLESDISGLNSYYKKLFDELPSTDNTVKLFLANAIIINSDLADFKEQYINSVVNYYDALTKAFSFSNEGHNAVAFINNWVDEKTNNGIDSVIDEIEPGTHSIFLNALYFKANWNSSIIFDPKKTKAEVFSKENGEKISLKFMHNESKMAIINGVEYNAIRLPYGNGAFCLDVILPNKGQSLKKVSSGFLSNGAPESFTAQSVILDLPKFTISVKRDLVSILNQYLPSAFSPLANFSKMTVNPVFIGDFYQKAKIVVNEDGTESSSVSVAEMMFGNASNQKNTTFHFKANRPFIFLIRETSTNAIITMGVYNGD